MTAVGHDSGVNWGINTNTRQWCQDSLPDTDDGDAGNPGVASFVLRILVKWNWCVPVAI